MNFELRQKKKKGTVSYGNSFDNVILLRIFAFPFLAWLVTAHKGILSFFFKSQPRFLVNYYIS